MEPIVILTGEDLQCFLNMMEDAAHLADTQGVRSIRFAIDGGLKVKVNGGTWSPPIGRIDE